MFRTLRWRLTLWFVLLTLLVYLISSAVGLVLFHTGMTSALDEELQQITEEMMLDVSYDQHKNSLQLRSGVIDAKVFNPSKILASVQLFDLQNHLVQEYGQQGVPRLLPGTAEFSSKDFSKRSMSTPVTSADGKVVGHLQVQVTTTLRDHATEKFAMTMALIMPFMVLSLGFAGYFFAGKAARPIEETFDVLRQFLSDAGHELGTPLAIIQAATENLQEQLKETPHEARLKIIGRTTERMSKLVQDLTLLAKMDVRNANPTKQNTPVSLDRIVKSCMEEFEDRFQDKQIQLVYADITYASVMGEQDSIHRLVTNLLDNALKYSNEGGRVMVSLKGVARTVRLTVEDSGIGIPPESVPRLFDRFYRVDKSRSRAAGGFGLGLSIVKAIAENHRATVEVSSEFGKGSRFTIVFPALPTALQSADERAARPVIPPEGRSASFPRSQDRERTAPPEPGPQPRPPRQRND